jgi:hypothetical protein
MIIDIDLGGTIKHGQDLGLWSLREMANLVLGH